MRTADYDGEDPDDSYWDGREPDDIDRAGMRFAGLFFSRGHDFDPEDGGHFLDPEIEEFAGTWDPEADDLFELFRAVLFLRGWRLARRVPWPALALLLRLLLAGLIREARLDAVLPLGADRRPAADLAPPVALLRAHALLTAAPPARVPALAGTTG